VSSAPPLPRCRLPRGEEVALTPLLDVVRGTPPRRATRVALRDEGERLVVSFAAETPDPRATLAARDADLWTEDVVELFIAPGAGTPARYFEVEVNPLGVLFDARTVNPHGDRREWSVDRSWDCAGLAARVAIDRVAELWHTEISLPWRELADGGALPALWRANFFRIDRPRGAAAEFSAWSPTCAAPPDFHRPARFGFLERLG
jgi:hypothetical protein